MTQPSPVRKSTPTSIEGGGASTVPQEGRWLRFWQIGWVVVTLTLVVLNIIAFPDSMRAYFTYTPTVLRELHQVGLSPTLYSVIGIILNSIIFQVIYLLLGLLLFLRRSNDRMALFCAFTLVTFGSAGTLYNFSSGDVVPALAANPIVHVVALVLFGVGETSFVVFFYLFPSGGLRRAGRAGPRCWWWPTTLRWSSFRHCPPMPEDQLPTWFPSICLRQ